jgi:hypothetical protein
MSAQEIRVLNISETGLGLDVAGIQRIPQPNRLLKVKLLVGKVATPLEMRLVHANTEIAGFEIQDPPKVFQGAVAAIFEPEMVGAALKAVQARRQNQLRFSDGRHTAIEISPATGFNEVTIHLLGGSIHASLRGPMIHTVEDRQEELSAFLRQIVVRILHNASAIPEPLRAQLETHFITASSKG